MTEEEMDDFFIETLKKILLDMKDSFESVKNENSEEYQEIKEDYEYVIEDLSNILKSVKTLDDLALLDEEEIGNVYEYIEAYTDNFVIRSEEDSRKKDLEEHQKLEELLDLFLDDDDEPEEIDLEKTKTL